MLIFLLYHNIYGPVMSLEKNNTKLVILMYEGILQNFVNPHLIREPTNILDRSIIKKY